jgi:hypothetical protein
MGRRIILALAERAGSLVLNIPPQVLLTETYTKGYSDASYRRPYLIRECNLCLLATLLI